MKPSLAKLIANRFMGANIGTSMTAVLASIDKPMTKSALPITPLPA